MQIKHTEIEKREKIGPSPSPFPVTVIHLAINHRRHVRPSPSPPPSIPPLTQLPRRLRFPSPSLTLTGAARSASPSTLQPADLSSPTSHALRRYHPFRRSLASATLPVRLSSPVRPRSARSPVHFGIRCEIQSKLNRNLGSLKTTDTINQTH